MSDNSSIIVNELILLSYMIILELLPIDKNKS